MPKHHLLVPMAIAAAFVQGAGAQHAGNGNAVQQLPTAATSSHWAASVPLGLGKTRIVTGTVDSIDSVTRRLVIKAVDGQASMIEMGRRVKDFANLREGDKVTVQSSEALAMAIAQNKKGDTGEIRQLVEANAVRQEPAGGKPGLVSIGRSTLVANVYQIDQDAGTVTLRGTDGIPVVMGLQDAQALQGIGMNDQVVISYVEATALSVQPSPY